MSWVEKRTEFQSKLDNLNSTSLTNINNLSASVDTCNPSTTDCQTKRSQLEAIKRDYEILENDIKSYVDSNGRINELNAKLAENGSLQQDIIGYEKQLKEVNIDAESAIARDSILRSRNSDITRHKLFILDRPLRKGLIPYLWALAILFIGIGLVIFKVTWPLVIPATVYGSQSVSFFGTLILFLTDKRVLISLLAASLITIAFLSMKIAGVFGK